MILQLITRVTASMVDFILMRKEQLFYVRASKLQWVSNILELKGNQDILDKVLFFFNHVLKGFKYKMITQRLLFHAADIFHLVYLYKVVMASYF